MKERINKKSIIILVVLIILSLLSVFVLTKYTTSQEFHAKTIESLEKKKITVMELTAATAAASAGIAAIPGDATTPIANQIIQLSSYLLIVIGALFLEKIMLTMSGYITFTFIVPLACLLYAIYIFTDKQILKKIAIKILLFGIVIFMLVPISVKTSDLIEKTYNDTINQTIEESKNIKNDSEKENKTEEIKTENENKNWWDTATDKVQEGFKNIGNTATKWIEKGEKLLSNFIDAIAILIITSCVIPILVLFVFIWIIKILFGIEIPNIEKKNKKAQKNSEGKLEEK